MHGYKTWSCLFESPCTLSVQNSVRWLLSWRTVHLSVNVSSECNFEGGGGVRVNKKIKKG